MRYFSYALIALGTLALGHLQLGSEGGHRSPDGSDAISMLFAGAALTIGLLMLTLSNEQMPIGD